MRRAGILCHLTSLPSQRIGQDSADFLSILAKHNISVWQMLPVSPPDKHGSPYASPSAFAIWDAFDNKELRNHTSIEQINGVIETINYWVEDWALYSVLKTKNNGAPWYDWPQPYKERDESAIADFSKQYQQEIDEIKHNQAHLMVSWESFRKEALENQVSLFGDLPFFVAHDSVDVWANQKLFLLNSDGGPIDVAGVPPDYFSKTGQRWGTVLYNWPAHKQQGFAWWKARMKRMFDLFDLVRIDHFRALEAAWAIPFEDETAEHGVWQDGPADELLNILVDVAPKGGLVAEDLGIIPPSVVAMRKRYSIPGMAVLHFAGGEKDNPHNLENHKQDMVVYTGTHDNDTTVGWGKIPVRELMKTALSSKAELAIIPLQDVMGLGQEARMNTPGTEFGNWSWQFHWHELQEDSMDWLNDNVIDTGRSPFSTD